MLTGISSELGSGMSLRKKRTYAAITEPEDLSSIQGRDSDGKQTQQLSPALIKILIDFFFRRKSAPGCIARSMRRSRVRGRHVAFDEAEIGLQLLNPEAYHSVLLLSRSCINKYSLFVSAKAFASSK